MKEQIESIRKSGRVRLASILERISPMRLKEYSASLWEYEPDVDMEPELLEAFDDYFYDSDWPESTMASMLENLKKNRVLQTATHLTLTEGPTFLAVHRMATAGLDKRVPYLVGAFSGIPFSNPAWSGCLNFSSRFQVKDVMAEGARDLRSLEKDDANRIRDGVRDARRISLIPSKMRETLVFRAPVPSRMRDLLDQLRPSLKEMVPEHNEIFCEFALSFCQTCTRKALRRKQMWYFELNEVIATYLLQVLPKENHPIHKLLFDQHMREELEGRLGEPITWFYCMLYDDDGSKSRFSKIYARADKLVHENQESPLEVDEVITMLDMGFFCPGVFLTFATLAFMNQFRCLGSFEQVEYLERYRQALSDMGWPKPGALDRVDTSALTTGRCLGIDGLPVYPLDSLLGLKWKPGAKKFVWDLIQPLVPRLLGQARG